jgi:hypothetical protein
MCTTSENKIHNRSPESGPGWQEHFVDAERASTTKSVGDAISLSFSYITIQNFASFNECKVLVDSAVTLEVSSNETHVLGATYNAHVNCTRFSVEHLLEENAKHISTAFVNRLLRFLEGTGKDESHGNIPAATTNLALKLFGKSNGLEAMKIKWYVEPDSEGRLHPEPKINVYSAGGYFKQHEDGMKLTVLVVLRDDFEGGGTAFFSEREENKDDNLIPRSICKPPLGTAIIWGSNLLHMAVPVISGKRAVYVGSFDLE